MPRRVHYEIYFHINWHTKGSLRLIKPDVEPVLYQYIKHKILETPEAICHAIGGIEDHIHLAVTLPPTVKPSEWIGIIKGASSHHMNQLSNRKLLEWQRGYARRYLWREGSEMGRELCRESKRTSQEGHHARPAGADRG